MQKSCDEFAKIFINIETVMSNTSLKIKNITAHLESVAPLSYQESYDNAGLLTGNPETEITSVLITLDCTEEIVDEAISRGCNLIVAHHPIIFSGLKKITGRNYVERTIIKAIKNDIAIYAIHTNIDNVHNGVNKKIADKIGLKNLRILEPKTGLLKKLTTYVPVAHLEKVSAALFDAGAGNIGNYDQCSFYAEGTGTYRGNEKSNPFAGTSGKLHHEKENKLEVIFPSHLQTKITQALLTSHPYEEVAYDIFSLSNENSLIGAGVIGELESSVTPENFLTFLKQKMNLECIRFTQTNRKEIKRVAICGGSGSFLIKSALNQNADAFVTADVKYHDFFDAEKTLMIADIGHYESEIFTKELLRDIILEKFHTFAVLLTELNTNPIKYF